MVRKTAGLAGLGVRDGSVSLELWWKRPPRLRRGGGGGGWRDDDLEGEAAREEASEEATMAFARESTVTEGAEWLGWDWDWRRRFWAAISARHEGW